MKATWSRAEMMRELGVKSTALWRWEKMGAIPAPIRVPGCHPRWIREEVLAHLAAASAAAKSAAALADKVQGGAK